MSMRRPQVPHQRQVVIMTGEAKGRLDAVAAAAGAHKGLPPVHLWNPPLCGDIGLKIARDGTWFYQNSPILRSGLVKLFASVLRRDADGHFLVTPVEKVPIEVEDAPFLAVELRKDGDRLIFRTNLDDEVCADAEHPLRFEQDETGGLKPYVKVRGDLWALVTRALTFDLVDLMQVRQVNGREVTGVPSGDAFFVMNMDASG